MVYVANFPNDGGLGVFLGYYVLEKNIHTAPRRLVSGTPSKPCHDLIREQCDVRSEAVGYFLDVVSGPCENPQPKDHCLSRSKVFCGIPTLNKFVTDCLTVVFVVELCVSLTHEFWRVNDPRLDNIMCSEAFHVVCGVSAHRCDFLFQVRTNYPVWLIATRSS
nr:MAG TPA: hypothetical protein [Caudoviricetes sp.]